MSEALAADYSDEDDPMSSDNEEEFNDFDDDLHSYGTKPYMPQLLPSAELSAEVLTRTTGQFAEVFKSRYPRSQLQFFTGSLDAALGQSIFNELDPRPLALYIRRGEGVVDADFCEKFFHHEGVVNILNQEFIVWPWDRTNMDYYQQFLKLLIATFGSEVASRITPYEYLPRPYPLLVCISNSNDRYHILNPIIDNEAQDEAVMVNTLRVISDEFHSGTITPFESEIAEWHMPNSHRTLIPHGSVQFKEILSKLNIEERKVQTIEKYENILWSVQYSSKKEKYEQRNGRNPNDEEFFYRCSLTTALDILQNGSFSNTDSMRVNKQENRFDFTRKRSSDESSTQDAIIICKIFIDESSPHGPVLTCDERILPEYLVVYTK